MEESDLVEEHFRMMEWYRKGCEVNMCSLTHFSWGDATSTHLCTLERKPMNKLIIPLRFKLVDQRVLIRVTNGSTVRGHLQGAEMTQK